MSDTITIEASDLVDFTFKIQQAILDGYRLSDQGDFAPMNIGWVFVTTMEKAETNPMPIADLSLAIKVDTEQALKDFQAISDAAVKFNLTDDHISPADLEKYVSVESNVAEKINEGAMVVEPNIVAPKQPRQTRGRK